MQEVTVPGRRHVSGRLFNPRGLGEGHRGVVFVHGLASSQRPYEQRARVVSERLDAVCLTFDLSGHGSDSNRGVQYSPADHLDDVLSAYDYLVSRPNVAPDRIGVCGASYGAYLTAVLTGHRAPKRVVLRAPVVLGDVDLLARAGALLPVPRSDELDSLAVLSRYSGEVLVVECGRDEVVPASNVGAYVRACQRARHYVIPDAAHALRHERWNEMFVNATIDWFEAL
jgi:uncharacterized protein